MLARINRSYVPAYWDDFFNDKFFNQLKSTGSGESRPAVNISEDDKGYTIELAVPGVAKEEAALDRDGVGAHQRRDRGGGRRLVLTINGQRK